MKPHIVISGVIALLIFAACKSNRGLFSTKKSAHDEYSARLESAGLKQTVLGRKWSNSAEKSLVQPVDIALPYRETGYFQAAAPRAEGLRFNIRQGEKLNIDIKTIPDSSAKLFTELWRVTPGQPAKFIAENDTSGAIIYEAEQDMSLLLRIQPELLVNLEYTVSISTGPSLAFPVRITDKPKISSFWGANRDGGLRKHEGVDIFARKGTPLIAAANGTVTRVNENNLGGKVIFMRPDDKSYSLYYAHLDSQMASPGQRVKTGDVIGLMGNTGNAGTTPPHLHFGIYTRNGAVDPFPFIERDRKLPAQVISDRENLNALMHTNTEASIFSQPDTKSGIVKKIKDSELMEVVSATSDWYRVLVNDSVYGFIPEKQLSQKTLQKKTIRNTGRLLHRPEANAAAMKAIPSGSIIDVIGRRGDFLYVKDKSDYGWLEEKGLLTIK